MQFLIAKLTTKARRDRGREATVSRQHGSSEMKQPLLRADLARFSRAAVLLPLVAALAGCTGEAKVADDVVRPVKVAVMGEAVQGRTLSYSGVVRPRIESAIGFRVPGKIIERLVDVGNRIEIDQTIAVLDETDLRLAEDSARANVAAARTRREIASINLERGKALLPSAAIAQSAYDTRRNEMDAAASALESAEAQLRQANNAVGYATLKADKAGIVTAVLAEPGQVMNAGQAVITLAHSGETEIAVAIPEQDAGFLTVGQSAQITLWAGPRASFTGKIREIAGQADAASRTYAIRIAVTEAPPIMRLGMTATVALRIDDEAAMVVPLGALTEADGSPVVFVVDPANKTVRKTDVTIKGAADGGVRIASGLHVGDWVVTAGVQFLRDGIRVRLPGERQSARVANPT
jgi:membrane fusion protein, multidrug efflux system